MVKRAKGEPRAVDPVLAGTLAMRVALGELTREEADRVIDQSTKPRRMTKAGKAPPRKGKKKT